MLTWSTSVSIPVGSCHRVKSESVLTLSSLVSAHVSCDSEKREFALRNSRTRLAKGSCRVRVTKWFKRSPVLSVLLWERNGLKVARFKHPVRGTKRILRLRDRILHGVRNEFYCMVVFQLKKPNGIFGLTYWFPGK